MDSDGGARTHHSGGLPHSDTPGSKLDCSSPRRFAACRVLLRPSAPRHPPCALCSLISSPDSLNYNMRQPIYTGRRCACVTLEVSTMQLSKCRRFPETSPRRSPQERMTPFESSFRLSQQTLVYHDIDSFATFARPRRAGRRKFVKVQTTVTDKQRGGHRPSSSYQGWRCVSRLCFSGGYHQYASVTGSHAPGKPNRGKLFLCLLLNTADQGWTDLGVG